METELKPKKSIVFWFRELPLIYRQWIVVGAVFLVMLCIIIFLYRKSSNAQIEAKVNSNKAKQVENQTKIKNQKNEIKQTADNHLKKQGKSVEAVQKIIKNSKIKPIHYEKIVVKDTALEYKRSVLDTARAD